MGGHIERISGEIADILLQEGIKGPTPQSIAAIARQYFNTISLSVPSAARSRYQFNLLYCPHGTV